MLNNFSQFLYKQFLPASDNTAAWLFSISTLAYFYFLSVKADSSIFIVIMGFFAIVTIWSSRVWFYWNKNIKIALILCGAYIGAALISCLLNPATLYNFYMLLLWPLCLISGYVMAVIAPERKFLPVRMNLVALLFTGLILMPCYDLFFGEANFILNHNRLQLMTPHPGRLAMFSALGIFLCGYECSKTSYPKSLIFIISGSILIVILYLTSMRTLILPVFIFVLIMLGLMLKKKSHILKLGVILAVLAIGMIIYKYTDDTSLSSNKKMLSVLSNLHEDPTIISRLAIWDASLNLFKEAPVFGHGVKSFRPLHKEYVQQHAEEFNQKYKYWEKTASSAHNIIIGRLVESGVIGTILYLAFYLFLLYKTLKGPGLERWVGFFLIFYLVVGMLNDMPYRINDYFIFFLAGAALADRALGDASRQEP